MYIGEQKYTKYMFIISFFMFALILSYLSLSIYILYLFCFIFHVILYNFGHSFLHDFLHSVKYVCVGIVDILSRILN